MAFYVRTRKALLAMRGDSSVTPYPRTSIERIYDDTIPMILGHSNDYSAISPGSVDDSRQSKRLGVPMCDNTSLYLKATCGSIQLKPVTYICPLSW